jgi:hypothetical protein
LSEPSRPTTTGLAEAEVVPSKVLVLAAAETVRLALLIVPTASLRLAGNL